MKLLVGTYFEKCRWLQRGEKKAELDWRICSFTYVHFSKAHYPKTRLSGAPIFFITTPFVLVLSPADANGAWLIAGYCFYGFLLINMVALWFADNAWRYFFHSVAFAIAYILLISILMPILMLKLNLQGNGESAMVFLFIIYHPAALLLIMLARWIHYKLS